MIHQLLPAFVPLLALSTTEKMAVSVAILFMMALGAYNIRSWHVQQGRADRLEEITETPISSVEPGLSLVSGVAKPIGETIERETQDGECLAMRRRTVRHEVKETRNRELDERNDRERETKRSTTNKSVPFLVEDDTGSILVSAENTPELSLRETDTVTERPPKSGGVKTREYRKYTAKIERTFRELFPGDDVTIFGKAVPSANYDNNEEIEVETEMILTEDEETGDFSVTHWDKEHLITKNSGHGLLIGGSLFVIGGAVALGYVWAII